MEHGCRQEECKRHEAAKKLAALRKTSVGSSAGNVTFNDPSNGGVVANGIACNISVTDETIDTCCQRWYSRGWDTMVGIDRQRIAEEVARIEMEMSRARMHNINELQVVERIPELTVMNSVEVEQRSKEFDAKMRIYSRYGTLSEMVLHYVNMDHSNCSNYGYKAVPKRGVMYLVHEEMGDRHCSLCTRAIERSYFKKQKGNRVIGAYVVQIAGGLRIEPNILSWSFTNMHTYQCFYRHGIVANCGVPLTDDQLKGLHRALTKINSGTRLASGGKVGGISSSIFVERMKENQMKDVLGLGQRERFGADKPVGTIIAECNEMMESLKEHKIAARYEEV